MDARERSEWTTATARTLLAERAARGWSREEMSQRSGIAVSTLRRMEGDRVQDVTQVARACDAFGISVAEFFTRASARLHDPAAL